MTDIHIPPAALEAGAIDLYAEVNDWTRSDAARFYAHLLPTDKAKWDRRARAAFVAMVEAWPKWLDMDADPGAALILPLMENPDDKA